MHLFFMLFDLQFHDAPTMSGSKCFKQCLTKCFKECLNVRFVSIVYSPMLSITKLIYFKLKTITAVFNVDGIISCVLHFLQFATNIFQLTWNLKKILTTFWTTTTRWEMPSRLIHWPLLELIIVRWRNNVSVQCSPRDWERFASFCNVTVVLSISIIYLHCACKSLR